MVTEKAITYYKQKKLHCIVLCSRIVVQPYLGDFKLGHCLSQTVILQLSIVVQSSWLICDIYVKLSLTVG